jgi:hypothetical protein
MDDLLHRNIGDRRQHHHQAKSMMAVSFLSRELAPDSPNGEVVSKQ